MSKCGQDVVKMWLHVVAGLWDLAQILGFGAQAAAGPAYHQSQSTEQVGTQGLFWATCDGHGHGSHAIHRNDELLIPRWPHAGWCYHNCCRNTLFVYDPVMISKCNHLRACRSVLASYQSDLSGAIAQTTASDAHGELGTNALANFCQALWEILCVHRDDCTSAAVIATHLPAISLHPCTVVEFRFICMYMQILVS